MEVILDELTPLEFFKHGGVVRITVTNNDIIKECGAKKKYTFFDYKSYIRFFRNLYMTYSHKHQNMSSYELYKYLNSGVDIVSNIGESVYVLDLAYDRVNSYEFAKFYYSGDKKGCDIDNRDAYGIKNVNFSLVGEDDERWDEYTKQRLERGFDDSELWNLDATIAKFIYPRLKAFYDADVFVLGDKSRLESDKILTDMIKGFELLTEDVEKTDDEIKIINTSLELFVKYFRHLWF